MTKTKQTSARPNTPVVSVIMPAHNAAEFLGGAIQSLLKQSFKSFELIVVNDGSTDQTAAITRQFVKKDKRVNLISYSKNKGESAAANIGFQKARGKYIARMDADDIAHSDRLKKQVTFLDKHSDYIVVGTQAHIIDENDQVIGQKVFPTTNTAIFREYGILHPMLHPSIMARRSMLPWSDKFWANEAEPNDDYYTLFHFLKQGKFANLPEKLMYYRMHSSNKSMQDIKKKFANSLKIRWYAIRQLNYPLRLDMIGAIFAQSLLMLVLPEWAIAGTFFWVKGIKSFSQAFPKLSQFAQTFREFANHNIRWEYLLPTLLASFIHSLLSRQNS